MLPENNKFLIFGQNFWLKSWSNFIPRPVWAFSLVEKHIWPQNESRYQDLHFERTVHSKILKSRKFLISDFSKGISLNPRYLGFFSVTWNFFPYLGFSPGIFAKFSGFGIFPSWILDFFQNSVFFSMREIFAKSYEFGIFIFEISRGFLLKFLNYIKIFFNSPNTSKIRP